MAAKEGCGLRVALVERASFIVLIFVSIIPPALTSLPKRGWASVGAISSHFAASLSISVGHGLVSLTRVSRSTSSLLQTPDGSSGRGPTTGSGEPPYDIRFDLN